MTDYENRIIQDDLWAMSKVDLPWRQLDAKTVLVTGATGMLASYVTWLMLYLNEHQGINVSVVALCRDRQKALHYYGCFIEKPYFRLLVQDVCDQIAYAEAVDYIFHLAGNASPYYINTDPVGIMRCNLQGTINVLELARLHAAKRVVFASTREVYGKNDSAESLDESSFGSLNPLDDRSCYPEGKRAAEALLRSYYLQYHIPYNIVRIAHSYGPTMNLENDGRVMADLLSDVVAGRDIVLKSTGEAVRAFVYLTDAVVGMFTVLFHANPATVYNLANETEPITVKDLALLMKSFRKDKSLNVVCGVFQDNTKGYCSYKRVALDTTKLEALGWKPLVGLGEGIRRILACESLNPDRRCLGSAS